MTLTFFGTKLKRSTIASHSDQKHIARVGELDVEVHWNPSWESNHGSHIVYPESWSGSVHGSVRSETIGHETAAKALRQLEKDLRLVFKELGAVIGQEKL